MSVFCIGLGMAVDSTSRPWLRCTGSGLSFNPQTLYAKCSSLCVKCSEFNGRLCMADSVANLWDHRDPIEKKTAFEPDLVIRCRDGASVFAHRFVLALRSNFFEAKIRLQGVLGDATQTSSDLVEVNLGDLEFSTREVVEAVVHFAYKSAPPPVFEQKEDPMFVCDVLRLANYLMVDDLVMADCNALMGGAGEVRSGILGRNPKFIMTYLKVGEEICNQSVMDTALLYLKHLPEIPEDFAALAPYKVMKSFLRHPEKFNFRAFRSNCGLGAVARERALLKIAVQFIKCDMESRFPLVVQVLRELRLAYLADELESITDMLEIPEENQSWQFPSRWQLWELKLLLRNVRDVAKMAICRTLRQNEFVSPPLYEPRPNSVKHFLWSTTVFGCYSPRGWKTRLKMLKKRKRESENLTRQKKNKKKKDSNGQAQYNGGDEDFDDNNNEDNNGEGEGSSAGNVTVRSLAGGEYPVDVRDFQFAGETQDLRLSRVAFHETSYRGEQVVCGVAVTWSDGKEEAIGDLKGNGAVTQFSLLPHEGCYVRVRELDNADYMGPVFLATSGHNEQYNSRLAAVRPMPGIGVERLPQVDFRPDFDYVKERTSDDLLAAVPPGGRFASSYKTLGRVEFNHFFLDGIRGKAVTFEPPTGLGKEERRVTLICRLSFKLSVLLNAPIESLREEFNVDMIKEEIELPNGAEFSRILKSGKRKLTHKEDIAAVARCPTPDRDVYELLHRVYPRKKQPAPPKEVGPEIVEIDGRYSVVF